MELNKEARELFAKVFADDNIKSAEQVKSTTILVLEALVLENTSILSMLEIHGTERSMLPVKCRIEDLTTMIEQVKSI